MRGRDGHRFEPRQGNRNVPGLAVRRLVPGLLLARPVDAWLARSPVLEAYASLRLVAMLGIVFGLHVLVSFTLSYYSGHEYPNGAYRGGDEVQRTAVYMARLALQGDE